MSLCERDDIKSFGSALAPVHHKLIIGENYDVLKNLVATYTKNGQGLIDVIYIDPPYNTEKTKEDGNDYKSEVESSKFVYRDKFSRTGWLNMMKERLELARKLLSDKGVIFISIDDNEQAYLKVLCDEIFGENNFIGSMPTIMNLKGNQDEFGFAGTHEYTLVYVKDKSSARFGKFSLDDEEFIEWEEDEIGYYKQGAGLKATGVNAPRNKRPNLYYPVYIKNNEISLKEKAGFTPIYPITKGQEMSWRWSKEKMQRQLNDVIVSCENEDTITLYKKQRPELGDLPSKKPKTLFYKPTYSTTTGTNTLNDILGEKIFNNPKPVQLLKDLFFVSSDKNSIVLDFFGGSGTTGQAVMELNEEDGGNRQCILVTNNENNIATDVTYERLYRVVNGKGTKGESFSWKYSKDTPYLTNNYFDVFNTVSYELKIDDYEKAKILLDKARQEFKKINPDYEEKDFDIYNQLASLKPYKK